MIKKLLALGGIGLLAGCQSSSTVEQAVTPPPMQPPAVAYAQPVRPMPPTQREVYVPGPPYRADAKTSYQAHASAGSFGPVPRSWIPAVAPHRWKYVVIHHSDTRTGSAAVFDRYHREVHHWNSLGYDFVIGNGTNSGNGQIEVGPRWRLQEVGAHAGVKSFNEDGIGICLVGDFAVTHPSAAQMKALAQLTGYLMRTYHIPPSHVIGHKDCGRQTNCPGRYMDLAQVRRMAAQYAGMNPSEAEPRNLAAGAELLKPAQGN